MKNLSKYLVTILVVIVFLLGFKFILSKKVAPVPQDTSGFAWKITQSNFQGPPGSFEVGIFLTGTTANLTQAAEVNLSLDNSLLKLTQAEPGGFFASPLTIKMDDDNLVYALSRNPTDPSMPDSTKPLVILRFEAVNGFNKATLKVLPTSQIYIKNTGGFFPNTASLKLVK